MDRSLWGIFSTGIQFRCYNYKCDNKQKLVLSISFLIWRISILRIIYTGYLEPTNRVFVCNYSKITDPSGCKEIED